MKNYAKIAAMKLSDKIFKSFIVAVLCVFVFVLMDIAAFYEWQHKIKTSDYEKNEASSLLPPYPFVSFKKIKNFDEVYNDLDKSGYQDGNNMDFDITQQKFRKPIIAIKGRELTGDPIILFGGSYSWGYGLKEEDTFGFKLAELSGSPVYNRAFPRWGLQQVLYQARRDDLYSKVPEPEYVIYIFIGSHIGRMMKYAFCYPYYEFAYLKYNVKKGNLVQERLNFNRHYFQTEWTARNLYTRYLYENHSFIFDIFKLHVLETKKEFQKHWKNTKFVMIMYDDSDDWFSSHNWIYNYFRLKELQDNGVIIIKTDDLTDELFENPDKYFVSKDDHHPGAKAWDLLTPKIYNELKKY